MHAQRAKGGMMQANVKTASSFELLGKRWSAMIVQDLVERPQRFREILNHLGRINDKVLSQRLRELVEAKIINRKVFPEVPIRVEYSLSDKGKGLTSVIKEMENWDSHWADGRTRVRVSGQTNGQVKGQSSEQSNGSLASAASAPVQQPKIAPPSVGLPQPVAKAGAPSEVDQPSVLDVIQSAISTAEGLPKPEAAPSRPTAFPPTAMARPKVSPAPARPDTPSLGQAPPMMPSVDKPPLAPALFVRDGRPERGKQRKGFFKRFGL